MDAKMMMMSTNTYRRRANKLSHENLNIISLAVGASDNEYSECRLLAPFLDQSNVASSDTYALSGMEQMGPVEEQRMKVYKKVD